jgi:hypothetical protein
MKIKNVKYFLAALSLGLFSCDNYLDINENPNQIQAEDITPNLQLPGAMVSAHRVQSVTMNILGNIWMQNWGGDVNNFTGVNIEEYNLQISNNFYTGIWDGIYPAVANFEQIINFNSPNYDNHKAVAYFMKSYYMQYIVDIYGDAPYSQAFKGQDNLTPAYDDDKAIYRDLITNIDKGIALLYGADSSDAAMGTSDVIFQGNVSNWLRFANTLKLKILLRQSEMTDAEIKVIEALKTKKEGYSQDSLFWYSCVERQEKHITRCNEEVKSLKKSIHIFEECKCLINQLSSLLEGLKDT